VDLPLTPAHNCCAALLPLITCNLRWIGHAFCSAGRSCCFTDIPLLLDRVALARFWLLPGLRRAGSAGFCLLRFTMPLLQHALCRFRLATRGAAPAAFALDVPCAEHARRYRLVLATASTRLPALYTYLLRRLPPPLLHLRLPL